MIKLISAGILVCSLVGYSAITRATEPEWAGQGKCRILVSVAPVDLKVRKSDEMPADVELDLQSALKANGIDTTSNLVSLQVIEYDPDTGKPIASGKYAFGKSEFDRPCRWYDAAIPYDFPEYENNLNDTEGKYGDWTTRTRWGYFYDCIGDWQKGRLAWLHRQRGNKPSYYAIYFDLLKSGETPHESAPRGFIGDGSERCVQETTHNTGQIHSRIDVDDFNDDGLPDIVVGCARGGMFWYPNVGTRTEPKFTYSKLLFTTDGKPIDIGWSATPRIADWDGDGVTDIITGVEWNRVAWFKNVGSNRDRKFVYKELVKTDDGKSLALPFAPCPEGLGPDGSQIYRRDYYPILDVIDWDGDGRADLLAGGYVTGEIFFYRNVGTSDDGTPILHYVGPVEADGKPIDVGWCAAPTAYDFRGTGKLDLVTGTMKTTAGGGDSHSSEQFLECFQNVGTRTNPLLKEVRLPRDGSFPDASIGTPRAVDMNGDGLVDLVVSAGTEIYIFFNVGSKQEPMFRASQPIALGTWGRSSLDAFQFIDWNHDGMLDAVAGWSVGLNTGKGLPGIFEQYKSVVPSDQNIDLHLSHKGDDWQFPRLYDLDNDGNIDLMNADHGGHIWFHRNSGTNQQPRFDAAGVMLKLADDTPIKVGPQAGHAWDFDVLQGARANYTVAAFTNSGRKDLVIGDAFRDVYFFENIGESGKTPVFAPAVKITQAPAITSPAFGDWNGDGLLDIILGNRVDSFEICLNTGKPGNERFASPQTIRFAGAPAGCVSGMCMTDFNGDGDEDVITETYYGFYIWLERSFVEHGYAKAQVIKLETK